jgi:transcriptional regulator with XRE-family HTH domain
MAKTSDFSWTEVGTRIRDWRHKRGLSQQLLAEAAGLTQNGIFRLESGETNPQLTTLQQIASALGCSVRELVVGTTDCDPILAQRLGRVKRVLESGDEAAIRVMDNGIETAEALLERSGGRRGLPPLRVKGEGRQNMANDLFWQARRSKARSESSQIVGEQEVQKARKPFGKPEMTDETKRHTKRS